MDYKLTPQALRAEQVWTRQAAYDRAAAKVEQRSGSIEDPTVPVSSSNIMQFFGLSDVHLPHVTVDAAMSVTAFSGAVTFLAGSLANLPLHCYQKSGDNAAKRSTGREQKLLNEAPNDEWTSFDWRKYFWMQVFTHGRGLSWIERAGNRIVGIWPMDPNAISVSAQRGRRIYKFDGRELPASQVIDVPFLLKSDMVTSRSPVQMGAKAIQLAIAMNDYASKYFAGGGVPPLAFTGPLPAGPDGMKRAMGEMRRSVEAARTNGDMMAMIPPGHELKPIGVDPAKGQMIEARLFQVQEIARIFNLPPVFLQDLSRGTFANVEQQDLSLIKHLITQWAKAFEEQINLKLFGAARTSKYAEHSLDALMRGDFLGRMQAMAAGVQNGLLTPNEGRALENRPPLEGGNQLYIQGATVPLTSSGVAPEPTIPPVPDPQPDDDDGAGDAE